MIDWFSLTFYATSFDRALKYYWVMERNLNFEIATNRAKPSFYACLHTTNPNWPSSPSPRGFLSSLASSSAQALALLDLLTSFILFLKLGDPIPQNLSSLIYPPAKPSLAQTLEAPSIPRAAPPPTLQRTQEKLSVQVSKALEASISSFHNAAMRNFLVKGHPWNG